MVVVVGASVVVVGASVVVVAFLSEVVVTSAEAVSELSSSALTFWEPSELAKGRGDDAEKDDGRDDLTQRGQPRYLRHARFGQVGPSPSHFCDGAAGAALRAVQERFRAGTTCHRSPATNRGPDSDRSLRAPVRWMSAKSPPMQPI